MGWRVAKSLLVLRQQVDELAPNRDKSSDGTIGDAAHQARNSDHNPNADGVVTAMDITNDPAHGMDAGALAEMLRLSKDKRIKYVISNRRIFSSAVSPWKWRAYDGPNAHTAHVHVSVVADEPLYDDSTPWAIDQVAKTTRPPDVTQAGTCLNIRATVFGGQADPNTSAYDQHFITDEELGVALPFRFPQGPRPRVHVINALTGNSVDCDIVDVGPWNTNDPYWESGARPQAESGKDLRGRRTNLAGIDLTPAAARAVGIAGKGIVNWKFLDGAVVKPPPEAPKPPPEVPKPPPAAPDVAELAVAIKQLLDLLQKSGGDTMASPANLAPILQQVAAVLQKLNVGPQATTPAPAQSQQQAVQLQKIFEFIASILNPGAQSQPLGSVNGALGQGIGNLLNGKKTGIGIIGALLSSLLTNPAVADKLGGLIGGASAIPGVGSVALPIFLALSAWGVLGKLEKWTQGPTPPPTTGK